MARVEDAGGLREEVERLRAANAALQRRASIRRSARRASVVLLLLLGCGLALLSVVAIWLRVTVLNTDDYVKTRRPCRTRSRRSWTPRSTPRSTSPG